MTTLTPEMIRTGRTEAPPSVIPLSAGPLTAIFQPDTGFLRHIRMGDHEVLRAVYGAVRDDNWDTVLPEIINLHIEHQTSGFRIRFEARSISDPIDFSWHGEITGEESGCIRYQFKGVANSDFLKNRIGLCVLHPIAECAGRPCSIEKVDGTKEEGVFPKSIAPHQPFRNIRAITHEPAPGVRAEVRMEGGTFEMEDQRNWTDASYKTYSPPLDHPFPVKIQCGETIEQTVTLQLPGQPRKILPILQGRGAQISITTTPVLPKPALGLCVAGSAPPLHDLEISRLKRLGLSHLRVDLVLAAPDWKNTLTRAAQDAKALGIGLQIALHPGDQIEDAFRELAGELEKTKPLIHLWQLFPEESSPHQNTILKAAQTHLGPCQANALFAVGSATTFAELNRHRPAPDQSALPCYPIHPQQHAFDDLTLVENIAAQPWTVESLWEFAPRAAVISPITLGPRGHRKPAWMSPTAETAIQGRFPEFDPRLHSLLGAGWALASLGRLITGGHLHSLTYFETLGENGIMRAGTESPDQHSSPYSPGIVYPVYHVLADLAGFGRLLPTLSSHPLQTEAMTMVNAHNKRRILAANLTDSEQEVRIKSGSCSARIRYLDESNAENAMRDPEEFQAQAGQAAEARAGKLTLQLKPYALARVDIGE